MGDNLIIVESPEKERTIEKFLGKDYVVKSSIGHIRDLSKKNLGIDIENGFEPNYVVSPEKKKVISNLKAEVKKAKVVWLASDEDREGEAIAWHLQETLGLSPENTKRIVFNEITKPAILKAIDNPRSINMDLVMAQQARRVLDRIVGFELSPILWRKIKPSLSAGRVQSAALRLIVDREREIIAFNSDYSYKVEGLFNPITSPNSKVKGTLDTKFSSHSEVETFLSKCAESTFQVASIDKKEQSRKPAAPFTTSSLQQEASRKFGFSVSQTMSIAQKLYSNGLITYMRTDSTNLSELAINSAKQCIEKIYGEEFVQTRRYKTKSKGAQEAHEAIRPTYLDKTSITGSAAEKKLYELIWKRTIASQMADAKLLKTTIAIAGDKISEVFNVTGMEVLFSGFLKVYIESVDDENTDVEDVILPELNSGSEMNNIEVLAVQKFSLHPPRYTEASLVKKMEDLGIGRPSTYASTISTIGQRGYVTKRSHPGTMKDIDTLRLADGEITKLVKSEMVGVEKNKLFPEDIGLMVIDFLYENFPKIIDYKFTANVEEAFDSVAAGEQVWNEIIGMFYEDFHKTVEETLSIATPQRTEKELGVDPKSGKKIIARMGKFGPLVQIGENDDPDKKFASITKGHLIETLTLEDALKFFDLPRSLGEYEGNNVSCAIGRFGPYVKYKSLFVSIPKGGDPYTINLDEAIVLINKKIEQSKSILEFPENDIFILNGRFGPYIKHNKKNFKIPKDLKAEDLTLEQCLDIIEKGK